jgi:hypothetical protein
MIDPDLSRLEMSQGTQPPSGLGERVLVGLAAVALVGGVLIALGNAVTDDDEVAQASPTASVAPSRTPQPVATPAPPRVATVVEPDVEIVPFQDPYRFGGWIRALRDLVIRQRPAMDAPEIGVLKTNDVARASQQDAQDDDAGWLSLDESQGWVATVADGEPLAHRYEYPRFESSGWVNRLTAGPGGFVATLTRSGDPYVNQFPAPAVSTDGARWRLGASQFDSWDGAVAWGPAGWLAAAYVSDASRGQIVLWSSSDGLRWSRLGMLAGVEYEYLGQLLGSDRGYLLETHPERGIGANEPGLWSSRDGLTWNEVVDPLVGRSRFSDRWIAAVPRGFYVYDANLVGPRPSVFSADGRRWSEVEGGPNGPNLQVTAYRDRLVAIDSREKAAPHVWSGSLANGQLTWGRWRQSDPVFTGGVVTQLVSDGRSLFAFGWDWGTQEPLVWTGDGEHWRRTPLPERFGGIPGMAAAWPGGVVVVGHRPSLRGDNPVFWHRTAVGEWLPEPDPVVPQVPDPPADACPALPADVLAFSVVDVGATIVCHGAAPITFRAWSVECNGCSGYYAGTAEPAWLLSPDLNQLYLSPAETSGDWQSTVILGPSLTYDRSLTSTWVEVTGHFDDPAARTCRLEPTVEELMWWPGPRSVIDQCRLAFVVTDVRVVSGP